MIALVSDSQPETVLDVRDVARRYRSGAEELTVLSGITFSVQAGASIAVVGPSGSGKSTLLGLCAGLDLPSAGSIRLAGKELGSLSEDARAALRGREVGFVFQNFQLIPTLTALENVSVPLELQGGAKAREAAAGLLRKVGLGERFRHYPVQLSGGEQQRVALARAFVTRPRILFADEPTGNLDDATSGSIEDLLFELNAQAGTTLVLVTHDPQLAARTGRVLRLREGRLESEETHEPAAPARTGTQA